MKYTNHILLLIVLCIYAVTLSAQAPHKMSFQAVVRNGDGNLVTNSTVSMRISILQGTETGAAVYTETHAPMTNENGLASLYFGTGTPVTGSFDSVDWTTGPYYLKVETDPSGGSDFSVTAVQQLVSVPYSLYSEKSGVPGAIDLPEIATGPVTEVSYTGATSTDTLKSNGGEFVTARGVCVDTLPLPTINSAVNVSGSSLGTYTLPLANLVPGKRYYLRAFASNSNGTAYGDTVSFITNSVTIPTVTTDTMSGVSNTAATGGGIVISDGGSPVTARGICFSTSASPTIANSLAPSGAGVGAFSSTMSGLSPVTTYYARAYATNAAGTAYGVQRTFTTILFAPPTTSTDETSNIGCTSVTTGLNTSSDGNAAITEQGICYDTAINPTTSSAKVIAPSNAIGHYTLSLTGLAPGTTYHVRAYSTNSIGTSYGSDVSFTLLPSALPSITTNEVIGINSGGGICGGNITADGCSDIIARGVCWSVTDTPTIDSSHTTDGTGLGLYNSYFTGLNPVTVYNIRAYATNSTGTAYGTLRSFTTDSVHASTATLPIVGTIPPVVDSSGVTSGGYISEGASITARGICWSTSPTPTLADDHTSDGTGLGYFTSAFSVSGCGTVFYIRAYATNSYGTVYGNEFSFTYTENAPVITSAIIAEVTPTSAIIKYVIDDGGCGLTSYEDGFCFVVGYIGAGGSSLELVGDTMVVTFSDLVPGITYRVSGASATNIVGSTVYNDTLVLTTGFPSSGHYLGELYAGGIIFYLDSTGNHGFVCAPYDQGEAVWSSLSGALLGTGSDLGTGADNTTYMAAVGSPAALMCLDLTLNGYSDWFLPSRVELNFVFSHLGNFGLGGLSFDSFYWSSSGECHWVYDDDMYHGGHFDGGYATCFSFRSYPGYVLAEQECQGKSASYKIRAIREF